MGGTSFRKSSQQPKQSQTAPKEQYLSPSSVDRVAPIAARGSALLAPGGGEANYPCHCEQGEALRGNLIAVYKTRSAIVCVMT